MLEILELMSKNISRQIGFMLMPLKRASRGRTKGGKGSSGTVQCTNCGQTVPKDKAKKVTGRINLVEHTLAKELRAQGAYKKKRKITRMFHSRLPLEQN